jgi:hypothetical protein
MAVAFALAAAAVEGFAAETDLLFAVFAAGFVEEVFADAVFAADGFPVGAVCSTGGTAVGAASALAVGADAVAPEAISRTTW